MVPTYCVMSHDSGVVSQLLEESRVAVDASLTRVAPLCPALMCAAISDRPSNEWSTLTVTPRGETVNGTRSRDLSPDLPLRRQHPFCV